jgi:hypothetical protein
MAIIGYYRYQTFRSTNLLRMVGCLKPGLRLALPASLMVAGGFQPFGPKGHVGWKIKPAD